MSIWYVYVEGEWPVSRIGPFSTLFEDTEEGAYRKVSVFRDMIAERIRYTVFGNEADAYANNINIILKETNLTTLPTTVKGMAATQVACYRKFVQKL